MDQPTIDPCTWKTFSFLNSQHDSFRYWYDSGLIIPKNIDLKSAADSVLTLVQVHNNILFFRVCYICRYFGIGPLDKIKAVETVIKYERMKCFHGPNY